MTSTLRSLITENISSAPTGLPSGTQDKVVVNTTDQYSSNTFHTNCFSMQTIARNPQATANTICSTFSSSRKMMLSLLMGVFVFLGMSFQGYSQCPGSGSITGAANTIICAGQGASVNTSLTGTAPFNGVFNINTSSPNGTSTPNFAFIATNNSAFAVAIPASNLTNTGTTNVVYTISWVSLSNAQCGAITNLTGSVTITVEPVANIAAVYNSPTQPICNGTPNFTVSNPNIVGGTFNVAVAYNGVTGGAGAQTGLPFGTFTDGPLANNTGSTQTVSYTFTPISPGSLNCSGTPVTKTVTVYPTANAGTINGTTPLCVGSTATYTTTGSNLGGTGTGAWSSTNTSVASVDPTTGVVTALAAGTTNITYTVTGGCGGTKSAFKTLTVNPLPTATISGDATVCQSGTSPNITFTGAGGTAPYTFTYNINGGSSQTVTTTSGSSVTVPVPTGTAGTFTYNLVSVRDNNTCTQAASGSAYIVVFPTSPVLTAPTNTCNTAFTLNAVTPISGFTLEYNIDGTGFTSSPVIPTTPGCHNITARYTLTSAYCPYPAGTVSTCPQSATVSTVIYPSNPTITAPANTCATALTISAIPTVSQFTSQYSFDGGTTYSTSNTSASTTPG